MAVIDIPDWQARLRARVFTQYASSNWAYPTANAIGAQAQSLWDLQIALLSAWSIDPITNDNTSPAYGVGRGAQLDRIGRLVGQARSGATDTDYRFYLRARIRANKSSGSTDDIIHVFQAMLGATELPAYTPGGKASLELRLQTPMTDAVADIARYFLRVSKLAGVRALLMTQALPDSQMFYTALATYVNAGVAVGDSTIDVLDASIFPTTGSVRIDAGLSTEETIAFSGRNGSTLYVPSLTTQTHDIGADVQLVGQTGLGFPVASGVASLVSAGDSTIDVDSAVGFSASGTIVIDQGLSTEETIAYGSIVGDTFHLDDVTAFAHDIGADVVEVGTGGALERVIKA